MAIDQEEQKRREEIARVIHEAHGIPEHVARRALDVAQAAFDRAWSEGQAFIELERDDADLTLLASTLFIGLMESTGVAKRGACQLSFLSLGLKYRMRGERN